MSIFTTMLLVAVAGVLAISLFYTWSIGKDRRRTKGNLDSQVPGEVQGHAYIRNPIFLTYFIALAIAIFFIVYFAVTTAYH